METLKKYMFKFMRFMYGRNGFDQLYIGTTLLIFILLILQIFIDSILLDILSFAMVIWAFYRFFSKDLSKRRAENQQFMKLVKWVQTKTKLPLRKMKDIKTHRYRTCSNCETTLRLPRKRGKHQVRCPRCKELNQVRIII